MRPEVLDWLDAIREEVTTWPGVTVAIHRFGGIEYRRGKREIGHIHSNGVVDLCCSGYFRKTILSSTSVQPHHTFPESAMVSFALRRKEDVTTALRLLRLSYETGTSGESQ